MFWLKNEWKWTFWQPNEFSCEHEHFNFNALVFFLSLHSFSLLHFIPLVFSFPIHLQKHLNECVSETVWCQTTYTYTLDQFDILLRMMMMRNENFHSNFLFKASKMYWTPFSCMLNVEFEKKILADVDWNYIDHVFVANDYYRCTPVCVCVCIVHIQQYVKPML